MGKFSKYAKLLALTAAGPVIFLALLPWLAQQSEFTIYTATTVAVLWVLAGSLILAVKVDKASDEWERSGSRFSYQWGGTVGGSIVAFLLALPPFHTLLLRFAAWAEGIEVSGVDPKATLLIFTAGFGAVLVAQALCTIAFHYIWRRKTLGRAE